MDESEQTIRRYLLGELSEEERSALEERYFTDSLVFEQLLKTESELVDAYVRNQLSNEARKRFEQFYMAHPSRSERVKFAAALATRLDNPNEAVAPAVQPTSPVSWWQRALTAFRLRQPLLSFSIALATLLIVLGGAGVLIESSRRQREAEQTRAANEAEQRRQRELSKPPQNEGGQTEGSTAKQEEPVERNPQQIPQPTPNQNVRKEPRSVSLALTAGGVRGGEGGGQIPTLVIPPDATQAQLRLNLRGNDYPSYSASLRTVGGAEIFSQTGVKPARSLAGASFTFTLPARRLASGDYVLTLRGVSPSGEIDDLSKSLFRVEKR